jgi:hypothetical protein
MVGIYSCHDSLLFAVGNTEQVKEAYKLVTREQPVSAPALWLVREGTLDTALITDATGCQYRGNGADV